MQEGIKVDEKRLDDLKVKVGFKNYRFSKEVGRLIRFQLYKIIVFLTD